jgi:hypothetical protein
LEKLAREAKQFKVKQIIVEENFGDGMFTKLLTPFLTRIYPCTTEEVKHSIQKEKRIIDTLEPVMNQHRLVVAKTSFNRTHAARSRSTSSSTSSRASRRTEALSPRTTDSTCSQWPSRIGSSRWTRT